MTNTQVEVPDQLILIASGIQGYVRPLKYHSLTAKFDVWMEYDVGTCA